MRQTLTPLQKQLIFILALLLGAVVLLVSFLLVTRKEDTTTNEAVIASEEMTFPSSEYWVNNRELMEAGGITVMHNHVPWDSPRRPGEVREIRFLTIHETDNRSSGADSQAHNSLLTGDTSDITGWHYTVDDHAIYHNIPDNEISWNAGDSRTKPGGNMNGIGIEMCVNLTNDFEATLHNTAAVCAELLMLYDLRPDAVYFHEDFMDKVCPHRLISEGRKEEFEQMIVDDYTELLKQRVATSIQEGVLGWKPMD